METSLPKSRLYAGGVIFIIGFLSPLLVPFVTSLSLPVAWKTAITGLLMLGLPELAMLAAVAIMGKEGFNYLKQTLFGFMENTLYHPRPSAWRDIVLAWCCL